MFIYLRLAAFSLVAFGLISCDETKPTSTGALIGTGSNNQAYISAVVQGFEQDPMGSHLQVSVTNTGASTLILKSMEFQYFTGQEVFMRAWSNYYQLPYALAPGVSNVIKIPFVVPVARLQVTVFGQSGTAIASARSPTIVNLLIQQGVLPAESRDGYIKAEPSK